MTVTLCVLFYNAESYIPRLMNSLSSQTASVSHLVGLYTLSNDKTLAMIESDFDCVLEINPKDFDHGGTRQIAVNQCQTDIVVFLTQDVILKPNALEDMISLNFNEVAPLFFSNSFISEE